MSAERVDEVTRLVLAPNPSPMTLDGTNTWLLGHPDHGAVVVVDPGPDDAAHRQAVEAALDGAEVAAVVITHHHVDHAEAAGWARDWGAELRAFDPGLVTEASAAAGGAAATPLTDGERLRLAGLDIEAVHTPGHASDHLCLRVVDTDVVLTGDHVLGRGSTVVNWPDGDMVAYMRSLERLARAPGRRLYPGHGEVVDDPAAKVAEYIAHREERRRQVLDAIAGGAADVDQIVATVYADVPPVLHPAAARSVKAVLEMLVANGQVDPALDPGAGPSGGTGDPSGLGDG